MAKHDVTAHKDNKPTSYIQYTGRRTNGPKRTLPRSLLVLLIQSVTSIAAYMPVAQPLDPLCPSTIFWIAIG